MNAGKNPCLREAGPCRGNRFQVRREVRAMTAKTIHIAAISVIKSTIPFLLGSSLQHADSGAKDNIQ